MSEKMTVLNDNPWHFLGSLGNTNEDHELIKLTRTEELRIVRNMIEASRVSILYAASGNGKSSLIDAGVFPIFRDLGYATYKTRPRPPECIDNPSLAFKKAIMAQVDQPLIRSEEIEKLSMAIETLRQSGADAHSVELLARLLPRLEVLGSQSYDASELQEPMQELKDQSILEFLRALQAQSAKPGPLLIVCDQFEELFVHYSNTPEMDHFVKELGDVWAAPDLKVHLLFSMREDWVGSMIEFRACIPEIFGQSFKLDPLRSERAFQVLQTVLETRHIQFDNETIRHIVADLASYYGRLQSDTYGDIKLTRSPSEDPFVEPPALQVLADALWRTRHSDLYSPFSFGHCRYLITDVESEEASPAQWVLEHYVTDALDVERSDHSKANSALRDLRVDCLYAMTDGIRHRRAVTSGYLLQEVKKFRRGLLEENDNVTETGIRSVIKPMISMRLVRPLDTGEYELAHDFAVRSVVREWRELDRKRAGEETARQEVFADSLNIKRRVENLLDGALLIVGISVALFSIIRVRVGDIMYEYSIPAMVLSTSIAMMSGILFAAGAALRKDIWKWLGFIIPAVCWAIILIVESSKSFFFIGLILLAFFSRSIFQQWHANREEKKTRDRKRKRVKVRIDSA